MRVARTSRTGDALIHTPSRGCQILPPGPGPPGEIFIGSLVSKRQRIESHRTNERGASRLTHPRDRRDYNHNSGFMANDQESSVRQNSDPIYRGAPRTPTLARAARE